MWFKPVFCPEDGFTCGVLFPSWTSTCMFDSYKFVDNVLLLRDGASLQSLRLYCFFYGVPMTNFYSWIIFALEHNVQVIDIEAEDMSIELIPPLFNSCSLRVLSLNLNHETLELPSSVWLSGLKIMYLRCTTFEDDKLNHLLACCPILETLGILRCSFAETLGILRCSFADDDMTLAISNPQLPTLIVTESDVRVVVVSAPSLALLEISVFTNISFLENPTCLVDAYINARFPVFESPVWLVTTLCQSLSLEIFADDLANKMPNINSPFYNLKKLKLQTWFTSSEAVLIIFLLKLCPNIETLVITTKVGDKMFFPRWEYVSGSSPENDEVSKSCFSYELLHLKYANMLRWKAF